MSEPLGVVRNISTARAMLDLLVYDDGFVVARGSLRSAVRTMAEAGVFRAGRAAVESVVGAAGERADRTDREALLSLDPTAEFLPFAEIAELRLKKDWFGNGRLEVIGADGTARRFDWKKLYNAFDDVAGLLERAAPGKVVRR